MITDWKPRTFEDRLLCAYWSKAGGRIYLEVPIGGSGGPGDWPPGSKIRRIDGVRVENTESQHEGLVRFGDHREEFCQVIRDKPVELIEVKEKLDRFVIGQVIAGADMFKRQYGTDTVEPVILCGEGDPALEWVCQQRGILVQVVESRS